jgi:hypothetical protein
MDAADPVGSGLPANRGPGWRSDGCTGRRQVEPEEPERHVEEAPAARGLGVHQGHRLAIT